MKKTRFINILCMNDKENYEMSREIGQESNGVDESSILAEDFSLSCLCAVGRFLRTCSIPVSIVTEYVHLDLCCVIIKKRAIRVFQNVVHALTELVTSHISIMRLVVANTTN